MIFISDAKEDHEYAYRLYYVLKKAGLAPWMDKPPNPYEVGGLQIGQKWRSVINGKLREASHVALLLSPRSVRKRCYVKTEFRIALSLMNEMPDDQVFVLPIISEKCEIPSLQVGQFNLHDLQWEEVKAADSRAKPIARNRVPKSGGLAPP
jgi:TIR domain